MYNENVNLDGNVEIVKKADELIRSMTEGYILWKKSLNSEYRNFLVSYLKYNKMDVYIVSLMLVTILKLQPMLMLPMKRKVYLVKLKLSKKDFYVEDTDSEIRLSAYK